MSLVYIGKLALSAILPASLTAVASASASLTATLPLVTADLAAAVSLDAQVTVTPPDLTVEIATTAAIAVGLTAAVSLGVPPFVDFQVSAIADLVLQLTPIVADLEASIALTLPLAGLFAEGNVQAWSFSGTSAELGSIADAAIAGGLADGSGAHATLTGFVLASTAGGTWTGMQTFFPPLPGTQPADSLEYLGSLEIGALVGLLAGGALAANVDLSLELLTLGARLQGAITCAATLTVTPPTLAGNITIVGELAANLAAYVSVPGAYVSASAAIAAAAQLVADLTALSAQLTADVSLLANITTALATAGVLAFTYAGDAAGFGSALASAVGGGWPDGTSSSAASNALILLASGSGTGSALSSLFGGL